MTLDPRVRAALELVGPLETCWTVFLSLTTDGSSPGKGVSVNASAKLTAARVLVGHGIAQTESYRTPRGIEYVIKGRVA